jgi:hypothetical protein
MEISIKRAARITPFMAFTLILLALLNTACEKESSEYDVTPLIGTWHQTSRTIDGTPATKDSTHLILQMNSNNICIICDSSSTAQKAKSIVKRSGWSYSGGLLNIAVDLPASYTATTGANTLSLERIDFNQQGNITRTVINFESTANIEFE